MDPWAILAVTFTNKAASEMAERVDKLLGHASLAKPLIATFHSLCVRMLRRDIEALKVKGVGLTRSFAIYDENDQAAIVKQIMRRMGLDIKQLTPRTVLGRISWANASFSAMRMDVPAGAVIAGLRVENTSDNVHNLAFGDINPDTGLIASRPFFRRWI